MPANAASQCATGDGRDVPPIGMAFAPSGAEPFRRMRCTCGQPENEMSCLTINDLSLNLALDRKAMAAIRGGGGAPWVYGWIQPYVPQTPSIGPVVNLYEVSNNFYANQMINQFQSVDVRNFGANSNLNVSPDARNRNDMV
jgi:hypothetical protein